MKNLSPRAAEWACEAVERLNRAHLRPPEGGHDRRSGRDLTRGSVRGYLSAVWKAKKEIPVYDDGVVEDTISIATVSTVSPKALSQLPKVRFEVTIIEARP